MSVEMTEEIKVKVIEYLQTFEQGIKKAGEFSAEQAPLVVQEFLAWEFWGNVIPAVSLLLLVLTSLVVTAVIWKKTAGESFSEPRFAATLVTGLLTMFLAIPIGICSTNAAKVAIAPRLVVLEKISSLMN